MPFPIQHPKLDSAGPAYSWVSDSRNPAAAGAVLLDAGALAAGDYEAIVTIMSQSAVGNFEIEVQRRNAANLATIWAVPGYTFGETDQFAIPRVTLAANERLRVVTINGTAVLTKSSMQYRRVG
jgi:hypothetical protein